MNIPFLTKTKKFVAPGRKPEVVWLILLPTFFVLLVAHGAYAAYLYMNPYEPAASDTQQISSGAAAAGEKKTEEILKEYAVREQVFANRKTGTVGSFGTSTPDIFDATSTAMYNGLLNTDPSR